MSFQAIPLFPGVPGGMELAVILLIAILLFGANKIPKLARSTGEAMGEFKKGRQQVEQELQELQDTATMDDSEISGDGGNVETPAEPEPESEETQEVEPDEETSQQ